MQAAIEAEQRRLQEEMVFAYQFDSCRKYQMEQEENKRGVYRGDSKASHATSKRKHNSMSKSASQMPDSMNDGKDEAKPR